MKRVIISDKIKAFRRENNLSQEKFGNMIGVSAQAVSKWERCECYPDITFLPELARTLSCSVDDLFG